MSTVVKYHRDMEGNHLNRDTILEALGFESVRSDFDVLGRGDVRPGRVVRVDRGLPLVATEDGFERAEPSTELLKTTTSLAVVGDWVALSLPDAHDQARIEAILPRSGVFARSDPGESTESQILVSHVDVVFIVQSLSGRGVNLRRLERELALAHGSGAKPVVVLSKADIPAAPLTETLADVTRAAPGVDLIVVSTVSGEGVDEIAALIPVGVTAVLLGESGVGKSSIVNALHGTAIQEVQQVREVDDKGRHTTVAREMVHLPDGGIIIDTPGMRSLALWDTEGLYAAFPEISAAAERCRFRDCTHTDEPGCAVVQAVEAGEIAQRRLDSFRILSSELAELAERVEVRERIARRKVQKSADSEKVFRHGGRKRHEPTDPDDGWDDLSGDW